MATSFKSLREYFYPDNGGVELLSFLIIKEDINGL